jgi:hypothetical protein
MGCCKERRSRLPVRDLTAGKSGAAEVAAPIVDRPQRLASPINTSAWQRCGAHQQTRFLPLSSYSAAMSEGCRTIQARYFAITSSRVPSRPMTNGFLRSAVKCPSGTSLLNLRGHTLGDTFPVSFIPGRGGPGSSIEWPQHRRTAKSIDLPRELDIAAIGPFGQAFRLDCAAQ